MNLSRSFRTGINLFLIVIFTFSLVSPSISGRAQDGTPEGQTPPGTKVDYNSETGRVNFLRVDPAAGVSALSNTQALARYASAFGLQDAARELRLEREEPQTDGVTLRYQQVYQQIPVLGGELLVNRDAHGAVVSINGEVSPRLAIGQVAPAVTAETALQSARENMKTWYGVDPAALAVVEAPALWIYDPKLLGAPAAAEKGPALVWRMVLSGPGVNEVVLVDAQGGQVALHYSQMETFSGPARPLSQTSGAVWYVDYNGSDENDCASPAAPCATINAALGKAVDGDSVRVKSGLYTIFSQGTIVLRKSVDILGGWNDDFSAQSGYSTLRATNTPLILDIFADRLYSITEQISTTIERMIFTGPGSSNSNNGVIEIHGKQTVTLRDCSLHHNISDAIHVRFGVMLTLMNTSITNNMRRAIWSQGSRLVLRNATIMNNGSQTMHGAVYMDYSETNQTGLYLQNSIIAGNAGTNYPECWVESHVPVNSGGHNLIGKLFGCTGFIPAAGDLTDVDAQVERFDYEGHAILRPESPAVDAGSPLTPGSDPAACEALDGAGTARPLDGSGDGSARCDMGALERPTRDGQIHLERWSDAYQIVRTGSDNSAFSVVALDPAGTALVGAEVTFNAPAEAGLFDGTASSVTVLSGPDGVASSPPLHTSLQAGSYTIMASLPGALAQVNYSLENYLPAAERGEIYGGNNQVTDIQTAFAYPFRVRARDQFGEPLAGVEVTFSAPASGPSGTFTGGTRTTTVVTGEDGMAITAAQYTANSLAGIYPLTATFSVTGRTLTFTMTNGNYFYVSTQGVDLVNGFDNTCRDKLLPCRKISQVTNMDPASNPTIYVSAGTFTEGVNRSKSSNLLGGWDADFQNQVGWTTLDGSAGLDTGVVLRGGQLDRFVVQKFKNGVSLSGTSAISNSAVVNNGNGVDSGYKANLSITNSTVGGNLSFQVRYDGVMTIRNSTISGQKKNTAILSNSNNSDTQVLYLEANIIAGNETNCSASRNASVVSLGNNLFDEPKGCIIFGYGHFTKHVTDRFDTNPRLSRLIDSRYYALEEGSPAIDPPDFVGVCPATDMRGIARPAGAGCDIGAFEYIPSGPPVRAMIMEGMPQSGIPGYLLLRPLALTVIDAAGSPVAGVPVRFALPESGPRAVFEDHNPSASVQEVLTGADGTASTGRLRAGAEIGAFTAQVVVTGLADTLQFALASGVPGVFVDGIAGSDTIGSLPNSCQKREQPCKSLTAALNSMPDDALVALAATPAGGQALLISNFNLTAATGQKDYILWGGWNPSFTTLTGHTRLIHGYSEEAPITIDKGVRVSIQQVDFVEHNDGLRVYGSLELRNSMVENKYIGLEVGAGGSALLENVLFRGSQSVPIVNGGTLEMRTGAIIDNARAVRNSGQASFTNVTISHNICAPKEMYESCSLGVFYNFPSGRAALDHVTIAHNAAFDYSPIAVYPIYLDTYSYATGGLQNKGSLTMRNSVVGGNRGGSFQDCQGKITSLGHNLVANAADCQFSPAEGDVLGSMYAPLDPLLGPLADNGGLFPSVALLAGSPAIDSGDGQNCAAVDVRGVARPAGAGCDMGAYEGSLTDAAQQKIYVFTANQEPIYMRSLLCESPAEQCTNGTDADAEAAYRYTRAALDFYRQEHGRNGIDNAGMPAVVSVHSTIYENNAFWSAEQTVFSNGYSLADDVLAHELTHGVTRHESRLINLFQPGSISESLSDVWGEYFDQINGMGNDDASVRWLMGEDLPAAAIPQGAIRNMSNPPARGQPDRMTSPLFYAGLSDNGGVHINNGINNKAVVLMVDGGTFNKRTVAPLGWKKTIAVYYYAQTHLLTSGADFSDLYAALNQACLVLTGGSEGINAADCRTVGSALDAVEMNLQPKARNYQKEAAECPTGYSHTQTSIFVDDFENGNGNWSFGAYQGTSRWSIIPGNGKSFYAASGRSALYGEDDGPSDSNNHVSDSYEPAMQTDVYLQPDSRPYLHFKHAVGFEYGTYRGYSYWFDGGVLEYSLDQGATWRDAKSMYSAGQKYTGSIYRGGRADERNPLAGRLAFTGVSHGYVSSLYNLHPLLGKTVRFRWRMGTDVSYSYMGWAVDDVDIYYCVPRPSRTALILPRTGSLITTSPVKLDWKEAKYAAHYEVEVAGTPAFTDLLVQEKDVIATEYTITAGLADNHSYYWRVRAVNADQGTGPWSSVFSFRTPLPMVQLISPPNETVVTGLRPTFTWGPVEGAAYYLIGIYTDLNLTHQVLYVRVSTLSGEYTPTRDLPAGRLLYWHVRAYGTNPGNWSPVYQLTAEK